MSRAAQSLTAKTVTGAVWISIGRLGQHGISLISTAVLARLLSPSAYGVMGMVAIVTGFLSIFRDLGTTTALVQRKELPESLVSTVFWANVALGLLATGISVALAPLFSAVYHDPAVTPVMMVLAVNFSISGLASTPSALLSRRMAFRRLSIVELVSAAAGTAAAIAMATARFGVWSLVGASLASTLVGSALLILAAGWRPALLFRWAELKSVASFSLNLSGFNVLNYLVRNADNFLIGRYLGAAPLGYYQFAYNLMLFPIQNVTHMLGRVLFPAFTAVQDDDARFRQAYLRSCAMIGAVTFPLMLGLLALAGPFVRVLLGNRWLAVVPILSVLVPVGLVQSVAATVGQIYTAKGRTDALFWSSVVVALVTLPAFVIGLRWGALGVAVAYAAANCIVMYFILAFAFRLIGLKMVEYLAALWPAFQCALLMFLAVLGIRVGLAASGIRYAPVQLTVCVLAGAALYFALLVATRAPALLDALGIISRSSLPVLGGVGRRLAAFPLLAGAND